MLRKSLLPLLLTTAVLHAEVQDAPAPDAAAILQVLKQLKDQQLSQAKSIRDKALRDAQAAAASTSAATAAWEEAIRETQFEGQPKEGTAFRAWKDKEGDALHDKEVQSAAQLYFRWLVLTLQHMNGKPTKDLLPDVVAYTRDLSADQTAMESFVENMKREEELAKSGKHGARPASKHTDQNTKQLHDTFLRGLSGSAPVKAMMIDTMIEAVAPRRNGRGGGGRDGGNGGNSGGGETREEGWTGNMGDFDGIYNAIILPELRANHDSRAVEYWDLRIKRAEDAAAKTKLAYDAEKFKNEIRPSFLWQRAQEFENIGLHNRATVEMFTVLKSFPKHPDAAKWISDLESVLMPNVAPPIPAVTPTPSSTTAPAPEPLPGAGTSRPVGGAPLPGSR